MAAAEPAATIRDMSHHLARTLLQRLVLLPAVGAVCRPACTGASRLSGLTGPAVVVANHSSHLDCPVLLCALPATLRRRTVVAAAADYFFSTRLRGAAVRLLVGALPVERRAPGAASLDACRRTLSDGNVLVMFPEGTRSRDGRMAAFKRGAAWLAIETGAPIIPMGIRGASTLMPVGATLPHRGTVEVHIGAPLRAQPAESAAELTARLQHVVGRLAGVGS